MYINPKQNAAIHAMLTSLIELAWKADYIIEVSKGRTAHISEITVHEANTLLSILREVERGSRAPFNPIMIEQATIESVEKEAANKLRRRILKCCHQLGWYLTDATTGNLALKNGQAQLDYKRINDYCMKHSHSHKKLNDHTITELKGKGGLVFQFESMERNYIHKS